MIMRSWRIVVAGVSLLAVGGCASCRCHPWFNGCGPISRLTGRCKVIPGHVGMPGAMPMPEGMVVEGGIPGAPPAMYESGHGPIFAAPPGGELIQPPQAPNFEAPPSGKELAPPPRPGANGAGLSRPVPTKTVGQ
jgi:hypothetical protein